MREFPPELLALLAHLRAALGNEAGTGSLALGKAAGRVEGAPNWPAWLALVERHRVGAFLAQRTPPALRAAWPDPVRLRLEEISVATTRRALAAAADQRCLVRLLDSQGIPVLAVKGSALAEQLYGGLGRRHVGDIDLLVRRGDVVRADGAIQVAGWRRTRPDFRLTPLQTRRYLQIKPEFEYLRGQPSQRLELLWRLEGLPDSPAIWSNAVTGTLGGDPLRTLDPSTNTLYLSQHRARHAWYRLFWLVDIALLLEDPGLDWEATASVARDTGVERPLLQAGALAHDLLGAALPPALIPRPSERAAVASLVREAARQIARKPSRDEYSADWFRQTRHRTRLARGPRAKFSVLAPHLLSPEGWRMWPLPDRWFFLYYIATPFLWLLRKLRRTAH
jgi:hypothetical protein